jgi:hypothetical protein
MSEIKGGIVYLRAMLSISTPYSSNGVPPEETWPCTKLTKYTTTPRLLTSALPHMCRQGSPSAIYCGTECTLLTALRSLDRAGFQLLKPGSLYRSPGFTPTLLTFLWRPWDLADGISQFLTGKKNPRRPGGSNDSLFGQDSSPIWVDGSEPIALNL